MTLKILLRVSVKRSSIGDYFVNFFIFADNVKCREVSRFRYLPSIYPRITMFLDSPAIKRDTRAVPTSPFIVRLRDFSTNLCSHVSWLIGIYMYIFLARTLRGYETTWWERVCENVKAKSSLGYSKRVSSEQFIRIKGGCLWIATESRSSYVYLRVNNERRSSLF